MEFIPAQTYTQSSASPVDCPALTPYPRACHDSFVIGFDGSVVSLRSYSSLTLHAYAFVRSKVIWQLYVGHLRMRRVP
ncbi:hypothetical protein SAMN04490191_4436 [Pseudomonas lini]|uniref:Uncharacterized protein n=1 Tax=Pseudomonas lini TaxID=163011 RepID=A0A1H2ADM9_9PSED|nr:hypothetical protein SAMN04490191_4436 [Pseudomonas lini]